MNGNCDLAPYDIPDIKSLRVISLEDHLLWFSGIPNNIGKIDDVAFNITVTLIGDTLLFKMHAFHQIISVEDLTN